MNYLDTIGCLRLHQKHSDIRKFLVVHLADLHEFEFQMFQKVLWVFLFPYFLPALCLLFWQMNKGAIQLIILYGEAENWSISWQDMEKGNWSAA